MYRYRPVPAVGDLELTDTQVAYAYWNGRWTLSTLLVPTSNGQVVPGGFLLVAASSGPDPATTVYTLQSFSVCPGITNAMPDEPILGVSHNFNGDSGRAVVGLRCIVGNSSAGDTIYDINLTQLQNGTTANYHTFQPGTFDLRPVTNITTNGSAVWLTTVVVPAALGKTALPMVSFYKLQPVAGAIADDTLTLWGQITGITPVVNTGDVILAPQPPVNPATFNGCDSPGTGNPDCIVIDGLDPTSGYFVTSGLNGDNYLATAYAAEDPGGGGEYDLAMLNPQTGVKKLMQTPFSEIVGYPSVTLDLDYEAVVNYTEFSISSPSVSDYDIWKYSPLTNPTIFSAFKSVVASSQAITSTCGQIFPDPVTGGMAPVCRWGDYTSALFDDEVACENSGAPECPVFWMVDEFTANDGLSNGCTNAGTEQCTRLKPVTDPVVVSGDT